MGKTTLRENFVQNLRGLARWFQPGLGVKRWFLLVLLGITMLGVGLALFLLEIYRTQSSNNLFLTILFYASLSFLPRELRIFVFAGIGNGTGSLRDPANSTVPSCVPSYGPGEM